MKSRETSRFIDIIIIFDAADEATNLVAARVSHPDHMKLGDRWTDAQLGFYNDFLDSVAGVVYNYFQDVKEYQSSKSYSYYIEFKAASSSWTIRLRISDHYLKRSRMSNKNTSYRTLFRQIIIGSTAEFTSYPAAIQALDEICFGIKNGDIDVISKDFTNTQFPDE